MSADFEDAVWAPLVVSKLLERLRPRERELVERRMAGDLYRELGDHFGVSVERARQIEQRAIRRMAGVVRRCEDTNWSIPEPPVRLPTMKELRDKRRQREMEWEAGQAERDRRVAKMLREKKRQEEWKLSGKVLTEKELDLWQQQSERFEEWKDCQGG